MNDNKYLKLPNADYAIIEHPNGQNDAIEIGLVKDHRFVFYFWFKWWKETTRKLENKIAQAPSLITIDWHRDLCAPCEVEKQDLTNLNLDSYKEVALFSWDKLNQLNDGHILAAAYLNLIGDIYVLCKQEGTEDENFIDHWGNEHKIKCFDSKEDLLDELLQNDINEIYFDIDLDYFTESDDPCGGGEDLTLMEDEDIISLLDINSAFMKWIFNRMEGMTIATEPKWCGGLVNSNKIYKLIDDTLFNFQLFSKNAKWKHLR
jgi:hypothetical protein